MAGQHIPVLLKETIEYLAPKPGQNFIDGTLGGGGHSRAILERTAPDGRLLAFDLDEEAIARAREEFREFGERVVLIRENFSKIKEIYNEQQPSLHKISGILLDLGFSADELKNQARGFSFQIDGELDMRYDKRQSLTAAEIVNAWPFDKLKKVIQEYGQESLASEITKKIINSRLNKKITKTKILAEAILLAFREKLGSKKEVPWIGGLHPATRTFQALRIAVNDELNNLIIALPRAAEILAPGGRLAVISFHSLEDKIVKDFFKKESRDCLCPPALPECRCGHRASLKIITKKAIRPDQKETEANPSSRSARLRVAEKI